MVTIKQKLVANKIVENHGNISKTMREVGYSYNTAKKPGNLTNSKGWNELMEEYFPDEHLAKRHKDLLDKEEVVVKNNNKTGKVDIIKTGQIDPQSVSRGLDMAYKLKNKYAPDKLTIIDPNDDLTDEQLEEEINRRKEVREPSKEPEVEKEG